MWSRKSATTRPGVATLACVALLAAAVPAQAETRQGWTASERELWWNGPQGSRILPYDWFLQLERMDAPGLFAETAHMAEYGFLPSTTNAVNPDGLPIGLSKERDRANAAVWLGMTCAACHTGALRREGVSIPIDGTGAMVDVQRFDRDLSAALTGAAVDDARFARLADRLGTPAGDRDALRARLAKTAAARAAVTAMNTPPHDPGPGRIDLQGLVMNAVTAAALDRPGNARPPDAPMRPPMVWNPAVYGGDRNTGGAGGAGLGPLLRNITEALGVYGLVDVARPAVSPAGEVGYPSSVSVAQLQTLEALLHTLEPPAWPADTLPPIDAALAERGASVFAGACAMCHAGRPNDAAGAAVPRVAASRVAAPRVAQTGALEGRPIALFGGPVFGARAAATAIVGHIGVGVAMQLPKARLQAGLLALQRVGAAEAGPPDAGPAPPLAGAWAAAPYLHNGSVPSLRQLLTPAAQRATRFTVGRRDFDPVAVGFPADAAAAGYVLDTTLPGNGNGGHEYGTALPEADKAALIEYLKTL